MTTRRVAGALRKNGTTDLTLKPQLCQELTACRRFALWQVVLSATWQSGRCFSGLLQESRY